MKGNDNMTTKHHGGTKLPRTLQKGTHQRPNPFHAGSGRPHGVVHDAPTRPMVNDQNYAGHKVKRK
jgi:hypothetical protein